MSNPHTLERISDRNVFIFVRNCAECDCPLIEIPDVGSWYCLKCKYFPSMEDTYMERVKIKRD